jgi:phosphoribosylanthranilate isomerase
MIKICGLTDETAVAAAVAEGADAVGFVFADSVRQVTPERAAELAAGVPASVRRVAVMLHPDNAAWLAVREVFRPQVLQTDAADYASLDVPADIERWPVFREGMIAADDELSERFLYEGRASGSGEQVDWARAAAYARRGQMILAGGLGIDNVARAIGQVRPWGVDVSSAVEKSPGRKDPRKIAAFIKAARSARVTHSNG